MRVTFVLVLSIFVFLLGASDNLKQIKCTRALEEIVKIISLFKNEIRYRKSDYSELISSCEKENLRYVKIQENGAYSESRLKVPFFDDFNAFLNRIGTTDVEGQLCLCDEYLEKFSTYLREGKEKEKTGGRVNLALSFLGSLVVIVVFL